MRTRIMLILAAVVALVVLMAPDASATIGFSQQVKLRDDHGPYSFNYTSFDDGFNGCSYCTDQPQINHGRLTLNLRTYRLVESNRKYDYYLVDATVSTSGQHGSRASGVFDADVRSTSKVNDATYSSGHSDTPQSCHTYTVSIAAAWGPLSAGTDVGSYSTCVHSHITRSSVSSGQHYHVTNFNGVKSVTFQRFDRVLAGRHPTFAFRMQWHTDHCMTTDVPSTGVMTHCDKSTRGHTYAIGTSQ